MDLIGTLLNKSDIQEFSSGFKTQEFYLDCSTFDQNTGQKYDNTDCWKDYEKRPEFFGVTKRVREKIQNQQIEGALVGAFNANLTARLQGIADKSQLTGDKVNPVYTESTTKVIFEDYSQNPNESQK